MGVNGGMGVLVRGGEGGGGGVGLMLLTQMWHEAQKVSQKHQTAPPALKLGLVQNPNSKSRHDSDVLTPIQNTAESYLT